MQTFNRKRLILAFSGLILAIIVHAYNGWLSELPFGLHETADDASYLAPAKNFTESGIWKDNSTGASAFVQRPPLMGILHSLGFFFFGKYGPVAVMCFAFALHGLAVFGLSGILRRFVPEKRALLITLIYVLLPCFWGFLSYQITESVSGSLIILTLFAAFSEKPYSVAITIVLFACCWFLRPVLILLLPVVIYTLAVNRKLVFSKHFLLNGISLVFCLTAVFLWEKRKADYTGEWTDLHPIYHETNQTMFRPVHKDMSRLFRIWETKPEDFHALMGYCWNEKRASNDPGISAYYNSHEVPLSLAEFGNILHRYSLAENEIQRKFGERTLEESDDERKTSQLIERTVRKIKSKAKFLNLIRTPLRSAKEMLAKSQLNLEIFQDQLRGNSIVEAIRYLSLATILLSLLFSSGAFFTKNKELIFIASGIFIYLFYLFFVQRMCEDRYILPALPLMLICGASTFFLLQGRKKSLS